MKDIVFIVWNKASRGIKRTPQTLCVSDAQIQVFTQTDWVISQTWRVKKEQKSQESKWDGWIHCASEEEEDRKDEKAMKRGGRDPFIPQNKKSSGRRTDWHLLAQLALCTVCVCGVGHAECLCESMWFGVRVYMIVWVWRPATATTMKA